MISSNNTNNNSNNSEKSSTKKKKVKKSTTATDGAAAETSKKTKKAKASKPEQPIESNQNRSSDVETNTNKGQPQALTINHVNRGGGPALGGCVSLPGMACMAILLLLFLGGGIWGWFTIPGLYEQIEELEAQVDRLSVEVNRFEALNQELNRSITELQEINSELNVTATRLESSVDDLEDENDRLSKLNDELETIASFLDETSTEIGETLDEVTEYLAEQITANRVIVLETLENTYRQDINNWDCAYRDIFRGRHFTTDEDVPIGLGDVSEVLNYVETRVLSELCANRIDFESFLDQQYQLAFLTSNQLFQGVALYSRNLLNYYFPNPGQTGLTAKNWADANYDCQNVPTFVYT